MQLVQAKRHDVCESGFVDVTDKVLKVDSLGLIFDAIELFYCDNISFVTTDSYDAILVAFFRECCNIRAFVTALNYKTVSLSLTTRPFSGSYDQASTAGNFRVKNAAAE